MKNVICVLIVLALMGCANSYIRPDEMRGGGDSDQEVLSIEGKATVTFKKDGSWTAACTDPKCKIVWITQAQANADRDAKIVEAAGEIAIKAMAAAPM